MNTIKFPTPPLLFTPKNLPDGLTDEEFVDLAEGLIVADIIDSYDPTTRSFTCNRTIEAQFDAMLHGIMSLAAQIYDLQHPDASNDETVTSPLGGNTPNAGIILPFAR